MNTVYKVVAKEDGKFISAVIRGVTIHNYPLSVEYYKDPRRTTERPAGGGPLCAFGDRCLARDFAREVRDGDDIFEIWKCSGELSSDTEVWYPGTQPFGRHLPRGTVLVDSLRYIKTAYSEKEI